MPRWGAGAFLPLPGCPEGRRPLGLVVADGGVHCRIGTDWIPAFAGMTLVFLGWPGAAVRHIRLAVATVLLSRSGFPRWASCARAFAS
jgi:hypothetical protein